MVAAKATLEVQSPVSAPAFKKEIASSQESGQTIDSTRRSRTADSLPHSAFRAEVTSGLYVGHVVHHRLRPVEHRFQYDLFMALIDLDEIERHFARGLFCSRSRWSLIQFRRSDYLGEPTQPLEDCVRKVVFTETGRTIDGPIRLLTHLRYFGFTFNPVSFYYCYSCDGQSLQAIVAEVTNTPWGERHVYVIQCDEPANEPARETIHCCDKEFHVSPFLEMDQSYRWNISAPGEQLRVRIENFDSDGKIFTAILDLHRQPFSKLRLAALLVRFPWVTVKVIVAIYWQALRLWLKRVPYVPHPRPQQPS